MAEMQILIWRSKIIKFISVVSYSMVLFNMLAYRWFGKESSKISILQAIILGQFSFTFGNAIKLELGLFNATIL